VHGSLINWLRTCKLLPVLDPGNFGHGDPAKLMPRNPRLAFE